MPINPNFAIIGVTHVKQNEKNQMVKILCLDGDGIGPEIATATRNVLAAVDRRFGLNLELQSAEIGLSPRGIGFNISR